MEEVQTVRKPREKKGIQKRDLKNTPLNELPDLLNIYETSDILMMSHHCLRRWIHEGKFPVIELTGGKKFVRKSDLLKMLDKSVVTYEKIEKSSVSPSV